MIKQSQACCAIAQIIFAQTVEVPFIGTPERSTDFLFGTSALVNPFETAVALYLIS